MRLKTVAMKGLQWEGGPGAPSKLACVLRLGSHAEQRTLSFLRGPRVGSVWYMVMKEH